jgi:hypothetical protein
VSSPVEHSTRILLLPGAIIKREVMHMVGDREVPKAAVDATVDQWLAHLRRQGLSDHTLERRARALGDAVRCRLPLPKAYQEFLADILSQTLDGRGFLL